MAALDYLTERGFTARRVGAHIRISPASKLTDEVRRYIQSHRGELLSDLPECEVPTGATSADEPMINRPLPRPRLLVVERADCGPPKGFVYPHNASPEWRQARDRYINHLMTCRACYAPTGRHCPVGADLRATYASTPMEPVQ